MTRKQFLYLLWKYLFRPMLWAAVLYVCINFAGAAIAQNGSERLLWYVGLAGAALLLLLGVAQYVLARMAAYIRARLSYRAVSNLRVAGKILGWVLPLAAGALLYRAWLHDRLLALFFLALVLVNAVQRTLQEEKGKTTDTE